MSAISSQALPKVPKKYEQEQRRLSTAQGYALLLQSNSPCSYLPLGLSKLNFETNIIKAREFAGTEDLRGALILSLWYEFG
jgi:hypothetical protein